MQYAPELIPPGKLILLIDVVDYVTLPPVNAQTPASRTEHDKSRERRAGYFNHKENDMTKRQFRNKHTGEQAVLLRIETLDDFEKTRVYVLNDVEESRWNESLLFEHWDEITEPQNESTMPATPDEHQEKRILP